jgi:integrase
MKTGAILCTKCDVAMTDGGICPKCGGIRRYIRLYWRDKNCKKGRRYKIRRDHFGYLSAVEMLIAINGKLKDPQKRKSFCILDYLAEHTEHRKFKNCIHKWLNQKEIEVNSGELSKGTYKDYVGYVENHWLPEFGERDIRQIAFEDLNTFKNRFPKALKIKTRRNIMNALRSAFNFLLRERAVDTIPPFPVIEGYDATPRRSHTPEEQAEGLSKVPAQHRDVIEFGFETGLRSGELCAIRITDIKAASRKLNVARRIYGGEERETTKGRRKDEITLSDFAWEIVLRNLRGKGLTDFLFINPDTGRRYTEKKFNEIWKKHSGFDTCFHEACRHSYCTNIGEEEENLKILQDLMRHADSRTTMGYSHPRDEKLREVQNRVSRKRRM